jgi:iron(III) transport system ATP-binding protein
VVRPRCLLLDEPLSNLDARLRLEMRGEIRRICKEFGLTAIYVTHDQKEALSIADRMAVLESGHIRQTGSPSDIYRHPESRFVADFMGETNFLDGTVVECSGGELVVETPLGKLHARSNRSMAFAAAERVLLSIRPESWTLQTVQSPVNSVAGKLGERMYLGETAQYHFATASVGLKIYELNPRFVDLSAERQVFATVAAEDVVVLPHS